MWPENGLWLWENYPIFRAKVAEGAGLAAIYRLAEGTHLVCHLPLTTLNLVDFFFLSAAIIGFICVSSFLLISNFLPQAKQNILLGPSTLSHVGRNVSGIILRPKTMRKAIFPSCHLTPPPSSV